jgi:hypothetical protein
LQNVTLKVVRIENIACQIKGISINEPCRFAVTAAARSWQRYAFHLEIPWSRSSAVWLVA